ncbi:MAG TPA: YoaK family protein [Polyangiaceae bacterium]|jgi:uncharacterized membrane protein YoaK (UPF0700 family)|nr:YoaK family protein [Polyangiaceae bacterium]
MSGNTAIGALNLEHRAWATALHRLSPIPSFLAGCALGRVMARRLDAHPCRFSLLLGFEVLALCAFLGLSWSAPGPSAVSVALLALAMGVQSVALRHAAGHDVRTTFVTGMLVAFVDELVDWVLGVGVSTRRQPWFHALIWASFCIGAFVGTAVVSRFGARAVLVPIVTISSVALIAASRGEASAS